MPTCLVGALHLLPVQAVSHTPGHPRCPFHRLEARGREGVALWWPQLREVFESCRYLECSRECVRTEGLRMETHWTVTC